LTKTRISLSYLIDAASKDLCRHASRTLKQNGVRSASVDTGGVKLQVFVLLACGVTSFCLLLHLRTQMLSGALKSFCEVLVRSTIWQ